MIVLITGASHTGKTALAQKLLEKYNIKYFTIKNEECNFTKIYNKSIEIIDDFISI